jgi:deoxyribonuclease V
VDVKFISISNSAIGAVLIFSFPDLSLIEAKTCKSKTDFPYIPGLLVFREGPIIEKCFEKIKNIPDLIFYDGQGYAHPRRLGIASHMGILLSLPSIGCAKKRLCGDYQGSLIYRGEYSFLKENDEIIGAALVTKDNIKPVFISQGHKISLSSAIKFTLDVSKFRIPEPIRLAHNYLQVHS